MTPTETGLLGTIVAVGSAAIGVIAGNKGKMSKIQHDEVCSLKLTPLHQRMERMERQQDKMLNGIEEIKDTLAKK